MNQVPEKPASIEVTVQMPTSMDDELFRAQLAEARRKFQAAYPGKRVASWVERGDGNYTLTPEE